MTQIPRPLLLVPLVLAVPSFLLFSCMPDFASLTAGGGGACARGAQSCAGSGASSGDSSGGGAAHGGVGAGGGSAGTEAGGRADAGAGGAAAGASEGGASGVGDLAGSGGASGEGGSGESSGTAGSSGTSSTGGSGGSSGTSGNGGTGGATPPCGGCAVLSSPITMADTSQGAILSFATPIDLTGATVMVQVRAPGATGGALQVYVQDLNFKGDYSFFTGLIAYATMTTVHYAVPAASADFDPTQIKQIVVQLAAGGGADCTSTSTSCTWAQPTVLQIDSIAITGAPGTVPGPYTFDSDFNPLALSAYMPIAGSTLTWVP